VSGVITLKRPMKVIVGLEIREYGRRDRSRLPLGTLYPQKLALTLRTGAGRSVGIFRSRTQATEFLLRVIGCEDAEWIKLTRNPGAGSCKQGIEPSGSVNSQRRIS
jgi:hypothetical protein